MLQSFKKLITSDAILNDVQQNVFDSITQIQKSNLYEVFEFDSITGLTNNSEITLGTFKLSAGEYLIIIQGGFNVEWSTGPTRIAAYLAAYPVNSSDAIGTTFSVGVDESLGQTWFNRVFSLKTNGKSYQLKGLINVTGGTVSTRDIEQPSVIAIRRNI